MFNRMEAFLFCPAEKYRQSPYQKALPILYYPITDMLPYPLPDYFCKFHARVPSCLFGFLRSL